MRKRHFYATLLAFLPLFLQAQIQFTAGIPYRLGAPSTAPSTTGSRFQVDLNTQRVYQWSPTLVNWVRVADGITVISGTAPPSYTPVDNQSVFAINAAGEFWYYNGATWETPGVPVSISSRLSGDGLPGTPLDLAQQGATTGQVLKWSGTAWTPAADGGTTYTAGTGIDVTGTVISNTGDLSATNELQTYSHSGTTSYTNTLSNSGGSFTLQSGTGITLSHTAGTTTITNSGDLSATNELQTLSTGTNTLTLSNGGGTVTVDTDPSGDLQTTLTSGNIFVGNGSNVATGVAVSGDATITNAGVVTVDKVDNTQVVATGATNGQVLKWNNGTSQWEPGNDGGTTYTAGTGIDVTGTVISNTGDLSATNEGSLTVGAGTGTTSVISSNTSGSTAVTLTAGTGLSISEVGNTITLANTGDLSATNELQTLSTGSNSLTLSNGGGTVTVDTDPANELQTYGHSGTTSYTNTLSNSGGSFTLQSGTGITLSHTAGTTTITNSGDLAATNEGSLTVGAGTGTTSVISSNTSGSTDVTLEAGTGLSVSEVGNTITITNSGDLSTTNELQTLSTGSNSLTLSNGGGTVTVDTDPSGDLQTTLTSGNIFVGNGSNVATGVAMSGDAAITNAGVVTVDKVDNTQVVATGATDGQVLKWSDANTRWEPGNDVGGGAGDNWGSQVVVTDATLTGNGTSGNALGIAQQAATSGQVLKWSGTAWAPAADANTTYTAGTGIDVTGTVITNTGDLSTTNEGSLTVGAGSGTTSVISSNTSGSTDVTLTAGTGLSISEVGNVITLANTGDLSATNELQTLSTGTNSLTLSNGGGTVTVDTDPTNEGSLTVAAGTGTTSVINSNTSGSTGVTLTAGTGLSISEVGNVITLDNTGDLSTTNELQTYSHSGTTSYTNTLSNSGGSFTLQSGTGITLAHTAGTTTITNSGDLAVTNEGSLTVGAGTGTTSVISSNTSGSTDVTLEAGTGISISETGNTISFSNSGDLSATNELQTLSTGSNSLTLSNGGGTVTVDTDPSGDLQTTLTSGNIFVGNGSNVATGVAMSGDATITNAGVVTVDKVDNTQVVATGATDGQVLKWSNANTRWEPGNDVGGGAGDNWGSQVVVTDATLTGNGTSGNALGIAQQAATSGQVLKWSGTAWAPDNDANTTYTAGTGIDVTGTVITNTGDLSATNEGSLTVGAGTGTTSVISSNTSGSTAVTLTAGTGLSISEVGNVITLANTGDLVATNEGSLTVGAGTGTTSVISSNTSGSTDVTLEAGTGLSISEVGNTITLANTGDLSATNELQTLSTGSNSLTLSNGGGTVTVDTDPSGDLQTTLTSANIFVGNGSNVATGVAVSGDATITNAGVVTVDKVDNTQVVATGATNGQVLKWNNGTSQWEPGNDAGTTYTAGTGIDVTGTVISNTGDLAATNEGSLTVGAGTGTTSVISSNTSGSTDVTLTAGTGLSISEVGNVITLANTGDLAATNEGSLTVGAGTGTTSVISSNTSGSTDVTLEAGTGLSISEVGNTITITNSGDLSNTNELQTYSHSGTTSYTNTLSNSGGSFTLQSGTGITLAHTAGTTTITNSGDLSTTNEGSLTVGAGTGTTSVISSNTSGSTDVTLTAGTGLSISEVGNVITLANTGDLAATNEGSLTVGAGTGTTSVISSNTSGSTDVTLEAGTGLSISEVGNVITLDNTGDLSATNELQTYSHSGTTSYTNTLSNSGGSFTLQSGTGITLSHTAGTTTITNSGDLSTTNEGSLTVGAGSGTTSVISSNTSGSTDVTLTAGTGLSISEVGNVITLANTGDLAVTNEGSLTVGAGTGTTSVISSNTSGSTDVTLEAGANITLSETGNTITIAAAAGGGTDFAAILGYVEGVTGTSVDLDALDGNTKDIDGTNLAFTIPSNLANFKVYKNGVELNRTGTGTTRDYSANNTTNVLTLQVALESTDRLVVQSVTGSSPDIYTSAEITGAGTVPSPLKLAQQGATSGQVLKWSGTAWAPDNDAGTSYTAGTGIDITTGVITNTGDLSTTNEGSLTVGAGTGTTSVISSNTSGSTDVTLTAGTGMSISEVGNTITITNAGDTNAADDLTTSTSFSGDVSGLYNNLQLGAGAVAMADINQASASTNQAITWNGSAWAPKSIQLQVKGVTVQNPTSSENITLFYTDRAITINKVADVALGTSPSVTYNLRFASTRNSGTPTDVFTANRTVTSSAGSTTTTFSDNTIPAASWVWLITSAQSGTVTDFNVTLNYVED